MKTTQVLSAWMQRRASRRIVQATSALRPVVTPCCSTLWYQQKSSADVSNGRLQCPPRLARDARHPADTATGNSNLTFGPDLQGSPHVGFGHTTGELAGDCCLLQPGHVFRALAGAASCTACKCTLHSKLCLPISCVSSTLRLPRATECSQRRQCCIPGQHADHSSAPDRTSTGLCCQTEHPGKCSALPAGDPVAARPEHEGPQSWTRVAHSEL